MGSRKTLTVRLWRCNNCNTIYGQEFMDGIPTELSPSCHCNSALGMEQVNVEAW